MEKKKRILQILTISAVTFIVLLLISLIMNFVKIASLNTKQSQLNNQLTSIITQIENNENELSYKNTDEYIDLYAREHLNMKGKDELSFTKK